MTMPALRPPKRNPVRSPGIAKRKASRICLYLFFGLCLVSLIARLRLFYDHDGGATEYQQQIQKRPSSSTITDFSPNPDHHFNATAIAIASASASAIDDINKNDEKIKSTPPEHNGNADFPEHYTAFSTGCSPSQDWQSLMKNRARCPRHVFSICH